MDISFDDFLFFLFLLGSFQGLILTGLLITRKKNKIANRLLGLLTLMWSIILFLFAFVIKGVMSEYPHLLRTITHIEFTFFPLLYLNIEYLLKRRERFNYRDLLHFIPLVFNVLLFSRFYFESAETKLFLVSNNTDYYFILNVISDELLALQGIIYSILALNLIKKYNSSLLNYQSNNDKLLIKFTKIGITILLISWVIGAIATNLEIINISVNVNLFIIVYLLIVFVIYIISYAAIRSEEIFKLSDEQISHTIVSEVSNNANNQILDENSPKESVVDVLNQNLLSFMTEQKPFLNPDLSLQDLADDLKVSRRQLSGIINQKHKVNFFEFVNTYRVEEVKKKMEDPKNKQYKILSLAYDAGFNSKASFNRIFKQHTHFTPSQFMKSF